MEPAFEELLIICSSGESHFSGNLIDFHIGAKKIHLGEFDSGIAEEISETESRTCFDHVRKIVYAQVLFFSQIIKRDFLRMMFIDIRNNPAHSFQNQQVFVKRTHRKAILVYCAKIEVFVHEI